jgi:hypothetical protein
MRRRNPLPRLAYAASPQRSEWLQTSKFNVLDGGNFEMYSVMSIVSYGIELRKSK